MIFAIGFGLFFFAAWINWANAPKKPGPVLSLMALVGMLLMLVSICMLIARYMP